MDATGSGLQAIDVPPTHTVVLHRHSIKPGHLDAWRELWPLQLGVWRRHGFVSYRACLQEHAEPKLTWLYSHPNLAAGADALTADPDMMQLGDLLSPHIFRNDLIRPVRVHHLTTATPKTVEGRIAIVRRYSIVGPWDEFLAIWRRIVPVREKYGFRCLFAVADEPKDMFTWAFDFAGDWTEFRAAQQPYYRDPDRVALRGVFDYMADYTIDPAQQLVLPDGQPQVTPVA